MEIKTGLKGEWILDTFIRWPEMCVQMNAKDIECVAVLELCLYVVKNKKKQKTKQLVQL